MSPRPKICQMVPTTFHGISSGSAMQDEAERHTASPARGIDERDDDPERDLDQRG